MKKGFTLIELIAVIGVLALLLLVIVPSTVQILNRSKENLNEEQIKQIESAASNWGLENLYLKEDESGNKIPSKDYVEISTLKNNGYLEDKIVKDLEENKSFDEDTRICIKYENNQYIYTLNGDECNE